MQERVILFHRQFMNKKIAITSLRRLYLKNRVKRKKVRQHKGVPQQTLVDFPMNRQRILDQLRDAAKKGQEVVYQDEIGFSQKSMSTTTWSQKNNPIQIDQSKLMLPNITAVVSVSAKKGLVYLKI